VRDLHLPAISVETNGLGRFLPGLLRRELQAFRLRCAVTEIVSRRNKDVRIVDAFDAVLAGRRLWAHRSVAASRFVQEMREWRPGARCSDDALDAVAGCLLSVPVRLAKAPTDPALSTADWREWRPGLLPATADHDFRF
jgi:hypothetical protein